MIEKNVFHKGKVIFDHQLLSRELKNIRQQSAEFKLVFTNGCFDLLHFGHVTYLQEARALGGALIVAINSDRSVRALKGPTRPIQSENDRAAILAALGCVDFVTVFDEPTPLELIKTIMPNILVKGGDWKPESIVGSDVVLKSGGEVKSLPFHAGRSTTQIVEKIFGSGS